MRMQPMAIKTTFMDSPWTRPNHSAITGVRQVLMMRPHPATMWSNRAPPRRQAQRRLPKLRSDTNL